MDSSRTPVQPGSVLAGKYQVERILGEGGMGVVVAAQHLQLAQRVAVKFMLPSAVQDATAVERFLREARAAVQIQSEHVARVIDVGTLETGSPFMVIEYLEGHDLAAELELRGRLSVATAIDYVLQATEAIAEAHAAGIVHRDLKPANLFVAQRRDGSPLIKVLDFGISKSQGSTLDHSLTATSAVMGSPFYMSPEQVRSSRSVDPRSDIWALGIILHELLTGRPAFHAETASALFAQIVMDPPPPLRETLSDAPAGLEQVILRCLKKDREERYPNVAELAIALRPYAPSSALVSVERIARILSVHLPASSGTDTDLRSLPLSPSFDRSAPAASTTAPWSSDAPKTQGTLRPFYLGGAALVLLGAALAFVLRRNPANSVEDPTESSIATEQPGSLAPRAAALAEPPKLDPRPEPSLPASGKEETLPSSLPATQEQGRASSRQAASAAKVSGTRPTPVTPSSPSGRREAQATAETESPRPPSAQEARSPSMPSVLEGRK